MDRFLTHRAAVVAVADSWSDVNRTLATDATPRLLKADEVAARWGLHRATVYRLVARGELPGVQLSYLATVMGTSVREIESTYFRWLTRTDDRLLAAFDNYDAATKAAEGGAR
jgi:predicted DNA-binding transcriptional regulator AlpA